MQEPVSLDYIQESVLEDSGEDEVESEDSMEWSDYIFDTLDEIRELNSSNQMIFENLTYSILLTYINYTRGFTMYNNNKTRRELFKEDTKTPNVSKRFIKDNISKIEENYRLLCKKFNTRYDYTDFVLFLVKYSYKF
jgi:hypothetical protein